MIFLHGQYFLYKPLFPSSQPSKTLKIESTISKSTWGITYSSFRPKNGQKSTYVDSFSYINPYFRAPSPLKPLKSSPRYQNLLGVLLRDHSDHRRPLSDPIYFIFFCCLLSYLIFYLFKLSNHPFLR